MKVIRLTEAYCWPILPGRRHNGRCSFREQRQSTRFDPFLPTDAAVGETQRTGIHRRIKESANFDEKPGTAVSINLSGRRSEISQSS